MKKIILSVVLIFLFCGCSKSLTVTSEEVSKIYEQNFKVSAFAVFGENKTEMEVTKNGMSIGILLKSPKELSGMGIDISDEHANISYDGMEQEISIDELPKGTAFLLLKELFDDLSNPDEFILSTENGNLIARGENFSAVLSDDLSVINANFLPFETEITFSEWEFSPAE